MTKKAPSTPAIEFITQRPREDGCGVVVLSMLTGKPYDEIASMVDWTGKQHHQTDWNDLRAALTTLGWQLSETKTIGGWDDIRGLAIVHVMDDHFMLYDADRGIFYDPWEWNGPQHSSNRTPLSFVAVSPPKGR